MFTSRIPQRAPDRELTSPPGRAQPATSARVPALGLALWAVAVLALHGVLLTGWPAAVAPLRADAPRVLTVRQLAAAPIAARAPAVPEPSAPQRPGAVARSSSTQALQASQAPRPALTAWEAQAALAASASTVAAATTAQAAAPATAAAASAPVPAPAAASDDDETLQLAAAAAPRAATPAAAASAPPTYRTRIPPSAVLRYDLRRGALGGEGELRWQHDDGRYELHLQGSVLGLSLLSQSSRGGFDAAGLAPERFLDRRRGREQRAANFQRERGLITYSGDAAQHPLLAGAQDRLSWMVQLAAIVDADPARWQPGTQVEMAVTGSRGDSDVWTFTVSGREAVELAGGRPIEALALAREPRKPHDTSVQVWLDPARHHLPVRLRLSNGRDGDALLFVLVP
ncbi:MAG: DUF3108 domain-containing protein [Rubrivivax sp.]|nr:DUF3108 domain-containing protein [Rubrivivax sp.]